MLTHAGDSRACLGSSREVVHTRSVMPALSLEFYAELSRSIQLGHSIGVPHWSQLEDPTRALGEAATLEPVVEALSRYESSVRIAALCIEHRDAWIEMTKWHGSVRVLSEAAHGTASDWAGGHNRAVAIADAVAPRPEGTTRALKPAKRRNDGTRIRLMRVADSTVDTVEAATLEPRHYAAHVRELATTLQRAGLATTVGAVALVDALDDPNSELHRVATTATARLEAIETTLTQQAELRGRIGIAHVASDGEFEAIGEWLKERGLADVLDPATADDRRSDVARSLGAWLMAAEVCGHLPDSMFLDSRHQVSVARSVESSGAQAQCAVRRSWRQETNLGPHTPGTRATAGLF